MLTATAYDTHVEQLFNRIQQLHNEKVRPEYGESVPSSPPEQTREGILVATISDLVRMKLTSYRLKDRVHIQDLDSVGLISPDIEAQLPKLLADRLTQIRATE